MSIVRLNSKPKADERFAVWVILRDELWSRYLTVLRRTVRSAIGSRESQGQTELDANLVQLGAMAFCMDCLCWLVRPCIRPVGAAFHVPLAIMPFAQSS